MKEIIKHMNSSINLGILPKKDTLPKEVYEDCFHFKFLSKLLDKDFEELVIHHSSLVSLRSNEHKSYHQLDISQEMLELAFEVLSLQNKITWNVSFPFISKKITLFGITYRLSLLHKSTGSKHHKYFLRKKKKSFFPIESYNHSNLLSKLFSEKKNIMFSGASSSGKTSLMQSLLKESCREEDVLVIEDTNEILPVHDHWTFLTSNNSEQLKKYCSYSVRMYLDRIILGEIRSIEIYPFILSMNTGLKGFMSTLHANNALDTMHRLGVLFELYSETSSLKFETVMKLLCSQIDFVVYMENKQIKEIIEVLNYDQRVIYKNITSSI